MLLDYHKINEIGDRKRLLNWLGRFEDIAGQTLDRQNKREVMTRPGMVSLVRKKRLKSIGRALVPKQLRRQVRSLLTGPAVDRYVPSDTEINFIKSALKDEISACCETAVIPTDR